MKDRVTHWFPCASAVLGPGARTWPPEAPGLELAPSLFWVLTLAWLRTLISGLTVRCVRPFLLMEKPLWAVRRPHKQGEYKNVFIFHPAGWQERTTKASWAYPRPHTHPLPSHKTDTVPSSRLRKSQILKSESYTPPRPHPQLCHSTRSGRASLRDQGRSPAWWPGLGSWESGAEAGGCGPRPRATGGQGSSPCSVKRS